MADLFTWEGSNWLTYLSGRALIGWPFYLGGLSFAGLYTWDGSHWLYNLLGRALIGWLIYLGGLSLAGLFTWEGGLTRHRKKAV